MSSNLIRERCSSIFPHRKGPPWNHETTYSLMWLQKAGAAGKTGQGQVAECIAASCTEPWPLYHHVSHLCLLRWNSLSILVWKFSVANEICQIQTSDEFLIFCKFEIVV